MVVATTKQKGGKPPRPKPEEHEGKPQHHHYPLEKRPEDRHPKYLEEQKGVA
jgi:hypothetical protein